MTQGQAVAFYNEMDPFAAEWLRNLIAAGEIPHGVVDQRSIADVAADELAGFTQCHFFAGIGIWPLALRSAGWPDDRPIWTGSCPCQPFSAAGKQQKFDDERHLWPVWFRLIEERRPPVVAGEQVASALDWLDLVSHDMEGAGYAFGASDLCAPGFGVAGWSESAQGEWLRRAIRYCPDPVVAGQLLHFAEWADANLGGRNGEHIRQRLYFVGMADANGVRHDARLPGDARAEEGARREHGNLDDRRGASGRVAESHRGECDRIADSEGCDIYRQAAGREQGDGEPQSCGDVRRVADTLDDGQRQLGDGVGAAPRGREGEAEQRERLRADPADGGAACGVADSEQPRLEGHARNGGEGDQPGWVGADQAGSVAEDGEPRGLAFSNSDKWIEVHSDNRGGREGGRAQGLDERSGDLRAGDGVDDAASARRDGKVEGAEGNPRGEARLRVLSEGHGQDRPDISHAPDLAGHAVDWLFCRDGRWRPVGPGAFPLVDESSARVGRLRAYGNALDAQTATAFCRVVREIVEGEVA